MCIKTRVLTWFFWISFHSHYTRISFHSHYTQYLIPFTLHKISHSSSHTHTISHSIHTTHNIYLTPVHIYTIYLIPFTLHTISHSIHTTHNISHPNASDEKQEKLSPSMNSKCKCEKSMGFYFFIFFNHAWQKLGDRKLSVSKSEKKTLNTHSSTPHTPYHAPTSKPMFNTPRRASKQTNKQTKQCVFHNTRKILFKKKKKLLFFI
jgi:hypothetical protein